MKALEKRYSKFLRSKRKHRKRDIEQDFDEALNTFEELGNYPCYLGHAEEYEEKELEYSRILTFLHNGLLRTRCTSCLDGSTSGEISFAFMKAFHNAGLREFYRDYGRCPIELLDFFDAHSISNLPPDRQLWACCLKRTRKGIHPFLTFEVSGFNQDWNDMFFQASAFLSEVTGIQYHLLIYFDMEAGYFNMSIILLERIQPAKFFMSRAEMAHEYETLAAKSKAAKRPSMTGKMRLAKIAKDLEKRDAENAWIRRARSIDIEARFGFRIVFGVYIDQSFFGVRDDGVATYIGPKFELALSTASIFEGSGIEIDDYPAVIVLNLDRPFFGLAWHEYLRLREIMKCKQIPF